MEIRPWTVSALCFAALAVSSEISLASPGGATLADCLKMPSNEEERSRAVARFLITYAEQSWDIAETTKPLRDAVSLEDDPSGDGTKLEFHDDQFETFHAGFFRYPDGSWLPSSLSTTSAKFRLPCGLKIGQSKMHVSEIVGAPTYVQSDSFIYATGGDQNGEVILEFRRNILWRVVWAYDTH